MTLSPSLVHSRPLFLQVPASPVDTLQEIESLTSNVTESFPHSPTFQLSLKSLRNTSTLVSPPSPDISPLPPSLPTLPLLLPLPPREALYGHPSMDWSAYEQLLSPTAVSFLSADLLLAYLRLCQATAMIHKGVAKKVEL